MKSVNDRFIEFYESLLSRGLVKNAADFAKKVEISTSLMTEIAKKRSNVGLKTIQSTVIYFDLNVDWLFTGNGSMLKNPELMSEDEIKQHVKEVEAGKWHHSSKLDKDFSETEHYNNIIGAMQHEISELKNRLVEYSDRISEQKETINAQKELIAMLKKSAPKTQSSATDKSTTHA